jgi:peptidyl-prolyl cis-trans isomerase SurA
VQNIRANEIVKLDRIVAIVNQGVITEQELVSRMQSVSQKFAKSGQELPPDNILMKQILDRLIIDSLQLQYAEKTGIKIPPEQVNAAIERIAQQNQLTITEFAEALTKDGLNMTAFKKDIKNEITMARLRDRQINSHITVTETEIDNLLTTQAANPDAQDEFEIAHIMINTPEEAAPADVKKAQEKADKAFTELQKGVAFSKVSAKYSDSANALEGGSLGWKKSTQIPTLFLNALKPLSKGEHSTILRSPNGFHILQLTDKRGENATLVIEQTHARHILIKLSEIMSDSEAKRKIDELKIRLDNNESFETLARQYSDDGSAANGGDLGWINPGDTVPPFEKAMNALSVNEISEPVKSQFGWHIIQVLEKRNQDMTKEAKRLKARQEIQARKSDEAYEDWIRELRDRAFIDLKLVDEY